MVRNRRSSKQVTFGLFLYIRLLGSLVRIVILFFHQRFKFVRNRQYYSISIILRLLETTLQFSRCLLLTPIELTVSSLLSSSQVFDLLLTIRVALITRWASQILDVDREMQQFLHDCIQINPGMVSVPNEALRARVWRLIRKVDDAMAMAEVIGMEITGEDGDCKLFPSLQLSVSYWS